MGWNTANEIVDPQIELLTQAVDNGEMPEVLAYKILVALIDKCQAGDWDTEGESLERFVHVPWVVRAFKEKGVDYTGGEPRTRDDVKMVVRACIDTTAKSWHDLHDDFARNAHASAIADALAEFLNLEV